MRTERVIERSKEVSMSTKALYRLSAFAGVLTAAGIILGKLTISLPNRQIGEILDFTGALFGLFFAMGVYLKHRKESGVFGGIAFIIFSIGLAAVLCLDYFGAFMALDLPAGMVEDLLEGRNGWVFAVSGLTFLVGEVLFGISVIRAGVFSKVSAILFMLGMIPVALHLTGIFPEYVVNISSVIAGIGLIWWSVELYTLAGSQAGAV
jgi:hypothetical protein